MSKTVTATKKQCRVRQDLVAEGLSVPVTRRGRTSYIDGLQPWAYRWLGDVDGFQILHLGVWWDAESIDFVF
jgi:hypothetical protein